MWIDLGTCKNCFAHSITWRKLRLYRTTIFQSPNIAFFGTCLDCFQSTQNLYVDRLGDPKHSSIWKMVSCSDALCNGIISGILFCTATVWSDAMWDETGPCNNSDKLCARCDCERRATGNQENDILADPFRCPKKRTPPGIRTSNLQAWSPTLWPMW